MARVGPQRNRGKNRKVVGTCNASLTTPLSYTKLRISYIKNDCYVDFGSKFVDVVMFK